MDEVPEMAAIPAAAPKKSRRVGIGIASILTVFLFMTLGSWVWGLFVLLFLFVGFRELSAMMAAVNTYPSKLIVLPTGIVMILCATLNRPEFLPPLLTMAVMASFFRLLFRQPVGSMADISGTLLALVYLAYLPVYFILLRELPLAPPSDPWLMPGFISSTVAFFAAKPGLGYILLVIAVISSSDTIAYYTGKAFGRSPLYPEVSPKKTREGALGGVLGGFFIGCLFSWIVGFPLQHGMVLSLVLTVVGQMGDMVESIFKRSAGIKDSGALLQGHGGLLDRADSYVFSGAVAYYYIYWFVLDQGLAKDFRHLLESLF